MKLVMDYTKLLDVAEYSSGPTSEAR